MRKWQDYQFKEFKIGEMVILDGKFKVKFIGSNFGKAQIKSAGYTRYVDFDRIKHIVNKQTKKINGMKTLTINNTKFNISEDEIKDGDYYLDTKYNKIYNTKDKDSIIPMGITNDYWEERCKKIVIL